MVIGGGPAGYSAAIRAAQKGANAALIEADAIGGTCLNRGCIPTKFLWEALHLKKKISSRASGYGIIATANPINFTDAKKKKDKTVSQLVKGVEGLCASHGVTVISGGARFVDEQTIEVAGTTYTASKFIIAAGSSPRALPGVTIDHISVLDSTDVLALETLPSSILIVGGGAIGIELAGIMAGFGCTVKLIEKENQLLPNADRTAADECKKILERAGVTVALGVNSIDEHKAGYEKILIAAGRQPNVETLDLSAAGIGHTARGITVNAYLETNVAGIYAAGDVTGKNYFAYTAQNEGVIAAENALGSKRSAAQTFVPWAVFTDPPIASVGLRTQDIQAGMKEGFFPIAANSKASIEGERTGWVKVISSSDDTILGGVIAGPGAPELITILSLAVEKKMNIQDLVRTHFFHPSIAESIFCALEDTVSECVELPGKTKKNL